MLSLRTGPQQLSAQYRASVAQEAQTPGGSCWPSTSTEEALGVFRSKKKFVGDMKPPALGGKHVKTK